MRVIVANILVINGPNLNLLGGREPEQYGYLTLQEIMEDLDRFASACGHELRHVQSNNEGTLDINESRFPRQSLPHCPANTPLRARRGSKKCADAVTKKKN